VPGEVDADEVRRIVTEGLAPYVGATMASASVNGHLEKLGVSSGAVPPEQVETLLSWLAPGLSVFIGPVRGAEIVDEIRGALSKAGGGA